MKKAAIILAAMAAIAGMLLCSGKNNSVGPLVINAAEEAKLFKVDIVELYSNGNADVNIYWLAEVLNQGDYPFSLGPTQYSSPIMVASSPQVKLVKIDDDNYYVYDAIVPLETMKTVSGGLNWNTRAYFSPAMEAGCAYYNPVTDNMAFSIRDNGLGGYYVHVGN